MATAPTMGRPTIGGHSGDTPEDITKRRLYWGVALAVLVLVAIGLAMRNRNSVSTVDTYSPSDTSLSAPTTTGMMNRDMITPGAMTAPLRGTGTTTVPNRTAPGGTTTTPGTNGTGTTTSP